MAFLSRGINGGALTRMMQTDREALEALVREAARPKNS
jgi:hypothetical protein